MAKVELSNSVYALDGKDRNNISYTITREFLGINQGTGSVWVVYQNGVQERLVYSTQTVSAVTSTNVAILTATQIVGYPFKGIRENTSFAIPKDLDVTILENSDGTARIIIDNIEQTIIDTVDLYATVLATFAPSSGEPGDGATVFTELDDTPSGYTGHADKVVVVNSGETSLEFSDNFATTTYVDSNFIGESIPAYPVTGVFSDKILQVNEFFGSLSLAWIDTPITSNKYDSVINGLTEVSATQIKLGGTLTEATSLTGNELLITGGLIAGSITAGTLGTYELAAGSNNAHIKTSFGTLSFENTSFTGGSYTINRSGISLLSGSLGGNISEVVLQENASFRLIAASSSSEIGLTIEPTATSTYGVFINGTTVNTTYISRLDSGNTIGTSSGRLVPTAGWVANRIGANPVNTLIVNPTITEDGYSITWDNTAGEYTLTSVSGGSGINAVVDDTTPELGGNLSANGFDITSPDGTDKIDIVNGSIDFETSNTTRLDITDSGVRLGGSGARVLTILDEDTMSSDSATALATQQSIKAYVDSNSGITNSAGANEIPKSDGTNLTTSGLYTTTTGDIALGDNSLSGTVRTIETKGSSSFVSLNLIAKNGVIQLDGTGVFSNTSFISIFDSSAQSSLIKLQCNSSVTLIEAVNNTNTYTGRAFRIKGADGISTSNNAENIALLGGFGYTVSGNGNGGNVYIQAGLANGSGTHGSIELRDHTAVPRIKINSTGLGFFNSTPVARPTGYTTFTNLTTDRTCNANSTSVAELADILGTLIVDLKSLGLIAS